jgi:uncharacterized protein
VTAARLPARVRVMRRVARQVPPGQFEVAWEPRLKVPAADGAELVTDHYLPVTGDSRPTILIRSPYGRGFPWDSLYGVALAEHGFHVVIQSCRGTGGSHGTFRWCHDEGSDGLATLAWLRAQPWFNGALGTIGPSYLGYTQWALAAQAPPELKALVVQVGMHRPYDGFYPGGVFALETALIGGIGTAHWHRGFLRMTAAGILLQARWKRTTRTLPLTQAFTDVFGARLPDAPDWLSQTRPDDPYWQEIDLSPALSRVTAAVALIGGWDDILLDQTLAQHRALRAAGREVSALIGPWTHTSLMNEGGAAAFARSLAWLRAHLLDDQENDLTSPVRVHVGGSAQWLDLADWPPPAASERLHQPAARRAAADDGPGPGRTASERRGPDGPRLRAPMRRRSSGPLRERVRRHHRSAR